MSLRGLERPGADRGDPKADQGGSGSGEEQIRREKEQEKEKDQERWICY